MTEHRTGTTEKAAPGDGFDAAERTRRKEIAVAILAARDRQRPMSREEAPRARDAGRARYR